MDPLSSTPSSVSDPTGATGVAMLKKSHDLAKQQMSKLIDALPTPQSASANPPGVGGSVDVSA